jgi:uncharacterized protein (DUF4415 family)
MRMKKNSNAKVEPWIEEEDDPLWTEDHISRAAIYVGEKLVRPEDGTWTKAGRPHKENPKKLVSLRLDPDVLQAFRATGKGWQSRINAELRKVLGI